MANALSDVGEALLSRWMFSTSSMSSANARPTAWFLALYTSAPSDAGGGTEVSGGSYARQSITFDTSGITNTNDLTFGPASADWGTVTHGAIFDDQSRFLCWAALTASKIIPNGTQMKVLAGQITPVFD